MASIKSNRAEVNRAVRSLSQALSFRGKRQGRPFGMELADTIAVAIQDRTINKQQDPNGRPLAKITINWREFKARHGYPENIGVFTGEMLELAQLVGEVEIAGKTMTMEYGLDEAVKEKAEWFQEIDPEGRRRARPFYDLGKDGEKAVDVLVEETLNQAVRDAGG